MTRSPAVPPARPTALARVVLALLVPVLFCRCATTGRTPAVPTTVPDAARRSAASVVVAPVAGSAEVKATHGARRVGSGAASGAVGGVLIALSGGPLGIVLAPIIVPAATLIGASAGGVQAAIAKNEAGAERQVHEIVDRTPDDLADDLARRTREKLAVLGAGAPVDGSAPATRLDVTVSHWGLDGGGTGSARANFRLVATWRLVPAAAGAGETVTPLAWNSFALGGPRLTMDAWIAHDGAALREALDTALDRAAESIGDAVLRVEDVPRPVRFGRPVCGLKPRTPVAIAVPNSPTLARVPEVDSVRPLLQWEPFTAIERAQDLRYDLRIWLSVGGGPGAIVYAREGLALDAQGDDDGARFVEHRVEAPLLPGTEYLWSVRARFVIDGAPRVSRWAFSAIDYRRAVSMRHRLVDPAFPSLARWSMACEADGIPPLRHHRFRTPGPGPATAEDPAPGDDPVAD